MKKYSLVVLSVLFIVNPFLFSNPDTDITLPVIKSESRGIPEQIFSKSPVTKFKQFARLYPKDIEGIQEIEFSSQPTDPVLSSEYKLVTTIKGIYHPIIRKIWINNYLGDIEAIVHEIGHHVWYAKLTQEHQAQWVQWFADKNLHFSITASKRVTDMFAEHYMAFRLHRDYKKQFPVQFRFFTDLLKK